MSRNRRPSRESLHIAAAWLACNDGEDGESEACEAVASWLYQLIKKSEDETGLRMVSKRLGKPVGEIKRILKRKQHPAAANKKPPVGD